jgi:hypothetical protein
MERPLNPADALFVINQNADVADIHRIAKKENSGRILILTTHQPFRNEILELQKTACQVEIQRFAAFLTDQDMQSCDDRATNELLGLRENPRTLRPYFGLFMRRSLHHKNEIVSSRVLSRWQPRRIYFLEGLGVNGDAWHRHGGVSLESGSKRAPFHQRPKQILNGLISRFASRNPITLVSDRSRCYVFFTPVKRLKFSGRVSVNSIPFSWLKRLQFEFSDGQRADFIRRFLRRIPSSLGLPLLATTIHEYDYKLAEIPFPIHVFVDGYQPSNYPRSYVDSYSENCIFIINHMFNAPWFEKHGKKTLMSMPFIQSSLMAPVRPFLHPLNSILLVLNHAGDWTSLINRSDTDLLIEAFSDLAERFPELHFVIRPHPTMAIPEHEGIHSIERIKRYVRWRNLSNLEVSEKTLSEDLQRGDLFISEYSQVLIDAFLNGKLGIIANLTSRRSFMEDYEHLGFLSVRGTEDLRSLIAQICQDFRPAVALQNQAAARHNELLKEQGYC